MNITAIRLVFIGKMQLLLLLAKTHGSHVLLNERVLILLSLAMTHCCSSDDILFVATYVVV